MFYGLVNNALYTPILKITSIVRIIFMEPRATTEQIN